MNALVAMVWFVALNDDLADGFCARQSAPVGFLRPERFAEDNLTTLLPDAADADGPGKGSGEGHDIKLALNELTKRLA